MKLALAIHASLLAIGLFVAPLVHAGPVEVFYAAERDPATPDEIVAPYVYGGGGLFISRDAGATFRLMCASQANPKLTQSGNDAPKVHYHDGAIYIPTYDGLWKGDKDGCNFTLLPELMTYVSDVAVDPLDPKRMYAATSVAAPAPNGLYMSDGGGPFAAFGARDVLFVNTIHVVKHGSGRRFYETGVFSDPTTNTARYSVRYSDDEAQTFTSNPVDVSMFGMMDPTSELSIIAIDPQNPERIIARVKRLTDNSNDNMLESVDAGKTFRNVMELGEFHALAFTPDGKLYFGDNDQYQRKLYVIDQAGGEPRMIGSGWKVSCLTWDDSRQRMLGCSDLRIGTVDLETGSFTRLLDMRCAESFVECPGAPMSAADTCKPQLTAAYCGSGHYPPAPVCLPYNQDKPALIAEAGYMCKDGMVTDPNAPVPNGTTGTNMTGVSGVSGAVLTGGASGAMTAAIGGMSGGLATAGASAGSAAPVLATSSGGCGCNLSTSRARDVSASWLVAVLGYGALRRHRRRATRAHAR